MSGTKRIPVGRPPRGPPGFTPEVLRLFAELELAPRRERQFTDRSRQLARLLNLIDEWWRGVTVNNVDGDECPIRSSLVAHGDWHRLRPIREQLLLAVKSAETTT
jgi:hypothetical protein